MPDPADSPGFAVPSEPEGHATAAGFAVPSGPEGHPTAAGFAGADGADLYFERVGDGPPLLMITGGGGDAGYYAAAAVTLARNYTVISYDRRGNSRSRLHGDPVPISLSQQGDDAVAVLAAAGFGSARIFGNSGGATILLDLATNHPEVIEAAVAHEPPVPMLLADPADYLAIYDDIDRVLAADGWLAAFTMFQHRIGLIPPGRPEAVRVLVDPDGLLPPGALRDLMKRVSGNWEYMMHNEVRPCIDYRPDLAGIRANLADHGFPLVLAHGATTRDQTAIQMSQRTADLLGVECAVFPGGHTAPVEIPGMFARELLSLLDRLSPAR